MLRSFVKWRQGAHTYRFKGLSSSTWLCFGFDSRLLQCEEEDPGLQEGLAKHLGHRAKGSEQDIFWDLDGTLTGTPNSYTSWADALLARKTSRPKLEAAACAQVQLGASGL